MQTPALRRCQAARGGSRAGLRVAGLLGPIALEQLVHQRRDFADLRFGEVAGQHARDILYHAVLLALVDGLGRGPDEHHAEFVLAVVVVIADLDFRSRLGKWAKRLQCLLDQLAKAAADIACPADFQGPALRVENHAGFVFVDAPRIDEIVLVDIAQPRTQRGFHLEEGRLSPQRNCAVYVYFDAHIGLQVRNYTPQQATSASISVEPDGATPAWARYRTPGPSTQRDFSRAGCAR